MRMPELREASRGQREALFAGTLSQARGVLHLGAHLAQEAVQYAKYGKPVLWVEALPNIFARLAKRLERYPQQQALCALLGDRDRLEQRFRVSNNAEGISSSIFEFGPYGEGAWSLWPELGLCMVDSVTLPLVRLDTLFKANDVDSAGYDFWVVDLQGAEKLALQGAGELLRHCRALYVEVSTVEVYRGGVLWPELEHWLASVGFVALWLPERPHDDVLFLRNQDLDDVRRHFQSDHYLRHNRCRLEHLAALGLPLRGRSVLEVGAGIGDHTCFYLDRGCSVAVTDVRPENLAILRERFAGRRDVEVLALDMDHPHDLHRSFDVIHCYGLLYHLERPVRALDYMARHCGSLLLLETCVSYGEKPVLNPIAEPAQQFSQSVYGKGCRPARSWLWEKLREVMPYVYATATQPAHEEFPLDWTDARSDKVGALIRAIFVASRHDLSHNRNLLSVLPARQVRA